jgi:hypothetical protein
LEMTKHCENDTFTLPIKVTITSLNNRTARLVIKRDGNIGPVSLIIEVGRHFRAPLGRWSGSHRRMTQPPSDQDQFGQRMYVHFLHDPVSMHLDRPFGRAQFKRNLFVDLASDQKVENLPLTRGQPSNTSAQEVQLAQDLS